MSPIIGLNQTGRPLIVSGAHGFREFVGAFLKNRLITLSYVMKMFNIPLDDFHTILDQYTSDYHKRFLKMLLYKDKSLKSNYATVPGRPVESTDILYGIASRPHEPPRCITAEEKRTSWETSKMPVFNMILKLEYCSFGKLWLLVNV